VHENDLSFTNHHMPKGGVMQGVAEMLGHRGPTGGDPMVAELLNRTFSGLKEATKTFEQAKKNYLVEHLSVYNIPFPQMTLLHSNWMALIQWEMAIAYTDGTIEAYFNQPQLPGPVYEFGDTLCDQGRALNKNAIKLASEYADRGKIPMSPLADPIKMTIVVEQVFGQWKACLAVIDRVIKDIRFINQQAVPKRMSGVHATFDRQIKAHLDIIAALKRDWNVTTMLQNKHELAIEMYGHTRDIVEIGQKVWAPYLIGREFVEALRRETTLAELAEEFDPWVLTDPQMRKQMEPNANSSSQLVKFWESVADRAGVLTLAQQVKEALANGHIRRRTGNGYQQPPWPSQFLVRYPITFGARNFQPGHLCAFYVSLSDAGETTVEVRRSGQLSRIMDLLGQGNG
jgi:hypothetical protein